MRQSTTKLDGTHIEQIGSLLIVRRPGDVPTLLNLQRVSVATVAFDGYLTDGTKEEVKK